MPRYSGDRSIGIEDRCLLPVGIEDSIEPFEEDRVGVVDIRHDIGNKVPNEGERLEISRQRGAGCTLHGGMATLPLNWDVYTNLVLDSLNTSLFSNFLGSLD